MVNVSLSLTELEGDLCHMHGSCIGAFAHGSQVTSMEECKLLCEETTGNPFLPDCQYYSYDTATSFCEAFQNCEGLDDSCDNCISASINCDLE